ncbi:MAG: L-seryl-tRNA(Sec) selenium transferase, partial [Chloroflexi bacterium]|nr:L-seryl-tRNA(Sec) selenium transferase [Chloroflexota bacterium]
AEAAVVVNNNAAAVMLAVNTLAKDAEVVTSRGELIEIGGSFRIPDVIERSDAVLVEVGTTNKTRIDDYANAITNMTRILLKVHQSNFKIVGFTSEAQREEMVALAAERELIVVEDLGSGTLIDLADYGLRHETTVQEVVGAGVDVVTFSGDKLLGGPQAGIIVGRAGLVTAMKKNPLMRALRPGKLNLAALEATLLLYLDEDRLRDSLPILAMLGATGDELKVKAETLCEALGKIPGIRAKVNRGESYAGGGSMPGEAIPTWVVGVRPKDRSVDELADALRENDPPEDFSRSSPTYYDRTPPSLAKRDDDRSRGRPNAVAHRHAEHHVFYGHFFRRDHEPRVFSAIGTAPFTIGWRNVVWTTENY